MRFLQRLATTTALVVASVFVLVVPALAVPGLEDTNRTTGGGVDGTALTAYAGRFGGPSAGGRSCDWQKVWPLGGLTQRVDIQGALSSMSFIPFFSAIFDLFEVDSVRALTEAEAQARLAEAEALGEDAPEIFRTIPGVIGPGEEFGYVEVVEGYGGFLDRLPLVIGGNPDLGVVINGPYADEDVADLTDDQAAGEHFRNSPTYPLVQRGETLSGGELWWDPYFIAPEDAGPGCPTSVFYSPRERNADILLPDVLQMVTELLPDVQPRMLPLDRHDGWAYVQVPTNFGVANASLQVTSAHAEVELINPADPGAPTESLWAEVVAVPTHLVLDPGDGGDPVVCPVGEMAYDPGDPGPCSYVYLDSSNVDPSGAFTATVSVIWRGIYRSSSEPTQVIDVSPTSQVFSIAVAEARPATSYGG